jgi:hypothetical protein
MECDYCCAENQAAAINNVLKTIYGLPNSECTSNTMNTCVFDKSLEPDFNQPYKDYVVPGRAPVKRGWKRPYVYNTFRTPEQKNCCTQEEFDAQKLKVMKSMEEELKNVPADPGGIDAKIIAAKNTLSVQQAEFNTHRSKSEVMQTVMDGYDYVTNEIKTGKYHINVPDTFCIAGGDSCEKIETIQEYVEFRNRLKPKYYEYMFSSSTNYVNNKINTIETSKKLISNLQQQKQVYTIPEQPVGYTGSGTADDPWKVKSPSDNKYANYPRFVNDEERKKYFCRENDCVIPTDYFYGLSLYKMDDYM